VDFALGALEHEGFVLRGRFTPGVAALEWCERRLLARIHRYTLDRLRREIEPVTAADFMRFLLRWQRAAPDARAEGPEGLAAVLELLDGYEVPAGAWEADVLPARLGEYDPLWLDGLCLSGRSLGPAVACGAVERGPQVGADPHDADCAVSQRAGSGLAVHDGAARSSAPPALPFARAVLEALGERGASFFGDLVNATGLLRTSGERTGRVGGVGARDLGQLRRAAGAARPVRSAPPNWRFRRRGHVAPFGVETAGRWSRVRRPAPLPKRPSQKPWRGSCCVATAWCSVGS